MATDETPPPVVEAELVEEESAALAVAHPQALEAMERAQQDAMVATAKRWPRPELKVIRDRMMSFATIDEETAESCFYTLKRKDKKTGKEKLIQGPSVRLAQIAVTCYGNIRAGSRMIANDGRKVTSQGICFDAENNVLIAVEESRGIIGSSGRVFSEDMQLMAARAASAIARRNAVLECIPRVLTNPVYEAARKVAVGTAKTLETRRQSVLGRFGAMGVTRDQILRLLEKESIESIDLEALELLIGLGSAIRDGVTTVDEVFATPAETEEEASARKTTLRDLARRANEVNEAKGRAKKPEATK